MKEYSMNQEFSFVLHIGIPHMNYLVEQALERGELIKTISPLSQACLYFWSPNHGLSDVGDKWKPDNNIDYYWGATHTSLGDGDGQYYNGKTKLENVSFPDFKNHFKQRANDENISFDRPLVVINNKYSEEHGNSPVNLINNDCISKIYNKFKDTHTIIYFRPESSTKEYVHDDNKLMDWNDKHLIKENHHEMIVDTDLFVQYPHLNYNELQCMMHSLSDIHFSTPGGNAIIASYFGGVNIIIGSMSSEQEGYWGNRSIWKTDSNLKDISGSKIVGMGVDTFLQCTESEWESWFEH